MNSLSPLPITLHSASTIRILPQEILIMIAEDLNVVALTQYIPALKGKITPETFTRLNALLIEKLQQESSSPLVKRIQMKVKETLLLRLVDEKGAGPYVERLNFWELQVSKKFFIDLLPKCPQVKKLNLRQFPIPNKPLELSTYYDDPERLLDLIVKAPKLVSLTYWNLVEFKALLDNDQFLDKNEILKELPLDEVKERLHALYDTACLEIAEGNTLLPYTLSEDLFQLLKNALTLNSNVYSRIEKLNIWVGGTPTSVIKLSIQETDFIKIFTACQNLREVNVAHLSLAVNALNYLPRSVKKLNLEKLNLKKEHIEVLPEELTYLQLDAPQLPEESMQIFMRFKSLTELNILDSRSTTHDFLKHLPVGLKRLKINLYSKTITGNMINFPSQLDTLQLQCQSLAFENNCLPESLTSLHVTASTFTTENVSLKIPHTVKNLTFQAIDSSVLNNIPTMPNGVETLKLKGPWHIHVINQSESTKKSSLNLLDAKQDEPSFDQTETIKIPSSVKKIILISDHHDIRLRTPLLNPYSIFSSENPLLKISISAKYFLSGNWDEKKESFYQSYKAIGVNVIN